METSLYFSLAFNVILLALLCFVTFRKKPCLSKSEQIESKTKETATSDVQTPETPATEKKEARIYNEVLHQLARECEEKLAPENRGRIKILVEQKYPQHPAILQIDELNLSIRRYKKTHSMFDVYSIRQALTLACNGYYGTARYIPVPKEIDKILAQRDIINVYLEALGLELINNQDDFWTIDVATGWHTGWKRFNFDVNVAYEKLSSRFMIKTPKWCQKFPEERKAKLFLLLKGWEHLFVEA